MNKEGLQLLRVVIQRDASMTTAVKAGDCKAIAAGMNAWMPADMQLEAVDVYHAMKGAAGFAMPTHNSEVLRARIDAMPTLFAARINAGLRDEPGIGAMQTIANELNLSPSAEEQVTLADVEAAMDVAVVAQPEVVAAGSAALIGISKIGSP